MRAPLGTSTGLDGRWTVDTTSARATFSARDLLHRPVSGTLDVTSGSVDVSDGVPVRAEARLDLGSVDTGSARRDRDLRGPRFFDVAASPVLAFAGGPARSAPEGWHLPGVLTLRGTSCALVLTVEVDDAEDGPRVRASTTLDRRDLGIHVPRLLVGTAVHLTVTALLRRVPRLA